mmetsp:Transcript_18613/g.42201  ORF Transcript_18613/g.42201 Transcript_18613/m.42201 type:complete len:397 (-) Transcript_18613:47-1237(-)
MEVRPPGLTTHFTGERSHTLALLKMLRNLEQRLQGSGFDLCHPVHTAWYNRVIQNEGLVESGALRTLPEPPLSLQDDGDADNGERRGKRSVPPSSNAVLIGNTKSVWPSFVSWLAARVEEEDRTGSTSPRVEDVLHSSPFDEYCEETISRSIQEVCCGDDDDAGGVASYELFWANGKRQKFANKHHRPSSSDGKSPLEGKRNVASAAAKRRYHCYDCNRDSFLVSMQRVANTTGQYWHDEDGTKLCVHPVYGTWTAFRVLAVFGADRDLSGNSGGSAIPPAPPPCPCPVREEELKEARAIFDYALEMNLSDRGGGGNYGATSDQSWAELCTLLHGKVCRGSVWDEVPESMKPWIELRNAISVGRNDWKYDDAQLLYHYTKDPDILMSEVEKYRARR